MSPVTGPVDTGVGTVAGGTVRVWFGAVLFRLTILSATFVIVVFLSLGGVVPSGQIRGCGGGFT